MIDRVVLSVKHKRTLTYNRKHQIEGGLQTEETGLDLEAEETLEIKETPETEALGIKGPGLIAGGMTGLGLKITTGIIGTLEIGETPETEVLGLEGLGLIAGEMTGLGLEITTGIIGTLEIGETPEGLGIRGLGLIAGGMTGLGLEIATGVIGATGTTGTTAVGLVTGITSAVKI